MASPLPVIRSAKSGEAAAGVFAGLGAFGGVGALETDSADDLAQLGRVETEDGLFVQGQLLGRLLFHAFLSFPDFLKERKILLLLFQVHGTGASEPQG